MKKNLIAWILFSMAVCPVTSGAIAQEVAAPAPAPAAPIAVPAAPAAAAATPASFPALPPARPCKGRDAGNKTWKLIKIYQEPYGMEASEFDAAPWVYMQLTNQGTYKIVKITGKKRMPAREFWDLFKRREGDPLQQYVAHDKGFIYFYNSGTIADTQACFIVTSDREPFKKNEMLLMPPAPADGKNPSMRMVKRYFDITPKPRGRKKK